MSLISPTRLGQRKIYTPFSVQVTATAGADPSATIVPAKTSYTFYVQSIQAIVTTSAAQSWTFKDTAGTPIVIAVLPNSASVDRHLLVDSDEGLPLTEGKGLDLAASAAGVAGQILVEGYYKQTAVIAASSAARII